MKKHLRLLLLIMLCVGQHAFAQIGTKEKAINYSSPSEYILGGITISGTKFLDHDILISLSGLKVGDRITIPGDQMSKTVRNLWDQGLFTNVEIRITKTIGSNIFLDIKLEERPRLSKFGERKSGYR